MDPFKGKPFDKKKIKPVEESFIYVCKRARDAVKSVNGS